MATTIPSGSGKLVLGNNLSEVIPGTGTNDTIYGYAGNDSINGFAGNDYIDGGTGNDTLIGGTGNNTLIGGAGDDYIDGSLGTNDVIIGGAGYDTAIYNNLAAFNNAAANGVENPIFVGTSGTVIVGTSGNDTLIGTSGDDTILGLAGNDTIDGLAGNDSLVGGPGNDSITGGLGNDIFRFNDLGDAFDTINDFNNTTEADKIHLSTGFNQPGATNPLVAGTPLVLFTSSPSFTANLFIGAYGNFTGVNSGDGVANGPQFYFNTGAGPELNTLLVDLDGRAGAFTWQPLAIFPNAPAFTVNDFVVV